jgi:2,4-dienoyl-CoA reductase-like NADH-dependent reductase (Old Yellow Enzyme family)/NADH dehydrogenase FAD-containing subunit
MSTETISSIGRKKIMKDPLFNPIRIGGLEIKNRIYLPAMHLNMAQEYQITEQLVAFYAERARGGVGMISVGYATVDDLSGSTMNIGAHSDEFIPGLKQLADGIKENGARSVVQLNHAGRYNFSFFTGGKTPVAPSAVPSRMTKETPRELKIDEIKTIVESFAQAARRVKEAGFDAVEVLSGTGYLISEFLSPLTNLRTDEYGGSYDNRMRFGLEVMQRIKAVTGSDYPLIVRMNGNDFMPGGQGRKELAVYARALAEIGVDALCINVGWHEARVPQITTSVPRGVFGYLAKGIKECVNVPVIASHRINDPATAREMIADGTCDMVAMGRPLIADPYLPEKAASGRENEIVHCIACAQGCFDHLFKLKQVECLCNPKAGHEKECRLQASDSPAKVVVVGGGPAGMSAALAAAECGHEVVIYEKENRLGGQLFLASAPPGRAEFAELAKDLATQVAVQKIRVVLNTAVDEKILDDELPGAVILATGAKPITPPIPGVERANVVQSWDVLLNRVSTGQKVVVIGGGAVGVETALFLAEKGTLSGDAVKFLLVNKAESPEDLYELATRGTKDVVLIEMVKKIGKDIGLSTRWGMLQDMSRIGVKTNVSTKALEITPEGVTVEMDGQTETLPADTVVLAVGSESHNPLQETIAKKGIPYQVTGDAQGVALAFDAVHNGFAAGRNILHEI